MRWYARVLNVALRHTALVLTILVSFVVASTVSAQSWPSNPVRIVVPFSAGGSADSVARITADWLTQRIGGRFIVENKPGAAGVIAAEFVARSKPDGYTLFFATPPQLAIIPLMTKLPYDPVKDFMLISIVSSSVFVLAVNDTIPATTLTEFVDYVRERPNQLSYSSAGSGSGTHLAMALFLERAGLQMTHVGYKGGAPAIADLVAGHVPASFGSQTDVVPFARSGKIRLLASSGNQRVPQLPDVPTVSESGYPGFHVDSWNGLVAAAGTPSAIIEQVAREIGMGAKDSAFVKKVKNVGWDPIGNSPAQFATVLESDIKTYTAALRASGIKPE